MTARPQSTALVPVRFHDDTIWCQQRGGEVYVAMRPVAENLGLAWPPQYQRINRHPILSKWVIMMITPSEGVPQKMLSLPLKYLNGWLFGIDSGRVKPEIRDRIIRYQEECFDVLYRHFFDQPAAVPEADFLNLPADSPEVLAMCREIRRTAGREPARRFLLRSSAGPIVRACIGGAAGQAHDPALADWLAAHLRFAAGARTPTADICAAAGAALGRAIAARDVAQAWTGLGHAPPRPARVAGGLRRCIVDYAIALQDTDHGPH